MEKSVIFITETWSRPAEGRTQHKNLFENEVEHIVEVRFVLNRLRDSIKNVPKKHVSSHAEEF